jgi:hypothetical protein
MSVKFQEVSLSSKTFDDICNRIRISYPNSCVLYIEEIINDELYQKYLQKKEKLEELRGPNVIKELQLFHGTKHKNIINIASNGFNTNYNKTSAYGRGTYFATNAVYSRSYTDNDNTDISYMLLCDILVGNCIIVSGPQEINTEIYDNSVDNLHKPSIYVSPYNDGCYPRYLIAFHKNAQ